MHAIPISLRQIDYVIAAAETGSTAAAARALNVSQPSVSLAIAKVEDHFGRPLFVRSAGQGIAPTAFGLRKLGALRSLRAQAQSALSNEGNGAEVLNLGVFSTLGPRYAPALVNGFQKTMPDAQIKLHEGDLDRLTRWLLNGRIDLALIYDFGLPSSLEITPLVDVRPYGLVARAHPLSGRGTVTMAELLTDPLILMSLPHSRDYFLTLAQMNGIRPRIAHETGSVEMLRAMVANHMGVGLMATDIAQDTACDGQPVTRLELTDPLVPHRIALARAPHPHIAPLVASFQDHVARSFDV
ncbi:DNA-binding transcriptional regulator, LysR family [Aliiroseovarius sediminilitoris]|uniref:DNA-binding transcriptional regulator, LysR family n=1 Tax=Aliiroseovarius sediminilitoris TaxID=1173584 RepID=A0A1I0R6F2_9RHOB|nr:LysR family transcriptional regulator [Aliiroseovarius sediminilitoris]SEW35960.1 DNA-binding transcriptional regulator, LysR family [Aliiroseovarius sediminilitoris]